LPAFFSSLLEVAKKVEAQPALGHFDLNEEKAEIPRFKDYAEIWLYGYIKSLRRHSTFTRYQDMLGRYIYRALGAKLLTEIRRGEIRDLLLKLHRNGLSKSTITLVKDVISGPLSFAVDEELIPINPAVGITKRLQLGRDKRITINPLNRDEIDLFLASCQEKSPEYSPFFLCAFRTGMRLGELLALQWGDVDWHGKFIQVQRSYKLGRINPTKTGKTRRVDMSDQLIEGLNSLYALRKKEALKVGRGEVQEVIFHRNGKHMEQNYIRRVFKRLLMRAGLREIRLHDIRHTFASLLLSDGASPVYVKEQLGHTSIQMTVDIYGHLIPSSNREMVNRLDTQPSATYTQSFQNNEGVTY
jgi:integrase